MAKRNKIGDIAAAISEAKDKSDSYILGWAGIDNPDVQRMVSIHTGKSEAYDDVLRAIFGSKVDLDLLAGR